MFIKHSKQIARRLSNNYLKMTQFCTQTQSNLTFNDYRLYFSRQQYPMRIRSISRSRNFTLLITSVCFILIPDPWYAMIPIILGSIRLLSRTVQIAQLRRICYQIIMHENQKTVDFYTYTGYYDSSQLFTEQDINRFQNILESTTNNKYVQIITADIDRIKLIKKVDYNDLLINSKISSKYKQTLSEDKELLSFSYNIVKLVDQKSQAHLLNLVIEQGLVTDISNHDLLDKVLNGDGDGAMSYQYIDLDLDNQDVETNETSHDDVQYSETGKQSDTKTEHSNRDGNN